MQSVLIFINLLSKVYSESIHDYNLRTNTDLEYYSLLSDYKETIEEFNFDDKYILENWEFVDEYDLWTSDEYVKQEIKKAETYLESGILKKIWNKIKSYCHNFWYRCSVTKQKYSINDKVIRSISQKVNNMQLLLTEDSQTSMILNYIFVSFVSSKLKSSLTELKYYIDIINGEKSGNPIFKLIEKLNIKEFISEEFLLRNKKVIEYLDDRISLIDKYNYENAKLEDFYTKIIYPIYKDVLSLFYGIQ